jgi:UDP-GlcNAc:undecaprenyl-phosphate GlcNAc-1-phosphate transferase
MTMFVPILDVTLSICRRFLRGQPIFGADRGHVHHRLLDRGLTPRRVVLLLYSACVFGAVLSLLQSVQQGRYGEFVILLFFAGAWLGIQQLDYAEFWAARKMVTGGALQRIINMNVQLREFEAAVDACESFEELWDQLCEQCRTLGFADAKLNCAGQIFEEKLRDATRDCWRVVIPIGERVWFYLSAPPDAARVAQKLPQSNPAVEYEPVAVAALSGR